MHAICAKRLRTSEPADCKIALPMVVRPIAIAFVTLMTACTVGEVDIGGDDDGGGGSGEGQSFNMIVKPLVTECIACHTTLPPPAISQPPNLGKYSDLQAAYKTK